MRGFRVAAAALAVVLSTAACGGGGETGVDQTDLDGGVAVLTAIDFAFQPSALSGGRDMHLSVVNEGQALHNFSIEDAGIDFDIPAGEIVVRDVLSGLEPGTHEFVCKYHVAQGMVGTLTVES